MEPRSDKPIAEDILDALLVEATPELVHAMNAALVVGADQELTSSTFVTRIAGSTRAALHVLVWWRPWRRRPAPFCPEAATKPRH